MLDYFRKFYAIGVIFNFFHLAYKNTFRGTNKLGHQIQGDMVVRLKVNGTDIGI